MIRKLSFCLLTCFVAVTYAADIDGDTDRNGLVSGSAHEEELELTQSVLVLNNIDDDDRDGLADNVNRVIDGKADCGDLEPIIVRSTQIASDDYAGFSLEEESDDPIPVRDRIRVFNQRGEEILGPTAGTNYEFSAEERVSLRTRDAVFHVEGLHHATSVRLIFYNGDQEDELVIEVAPFILLPHTQPALANMVIDVGDDFSAKYTQSFSSACRKAGVRPWVLKPESGSGQSWIQDEIQWGYSQTARVTLPSVLHMLRENRPSGLHGTAMRLIQPGVGYFEAWYYGPQESRRGAHDSGGNLEVTPPTEAYPLGRVYYGSRLSEELQTMQNSIDEEFQYFFERQQVQPPINLKTDWLTVGHVDEVVNFLPTDEGKSFVMILASPSRGLDILRNMGPEAELDMKYWKYIKHDGSHESPPLVRDLLEQKYAIGQTGSEVEYSFEEYNLQIDRLIHGDNHHDRDEDSLGGTMTQALDLPSQRIIEVPVLFFNEGNVWAASALTPNMVNLSSMGRFSMVANPFLDAFRDDFIRQLKPHGQTPLWIDNWRDFHEKGGSVHCASNVRRQPFSTPWWRMESETVTED